MYNNLPGQKTRIGVVLKQWVIFDILSTALVHSSTIIIKHSSALLVLIWMNKKNDITF